MALCLLSCPVLSPQLSSSPRLLASFPSPRSAARHRVSLVRWSRISVVEPLLTPQLSRLDQNQVTAVCILSIVNNDIYLLFKISLVFPKIEVAWLYSAICIKKKKKVSPSLVRAVVSQVPLSKLKSPVSVYQIYPSLRINYNTFLCHIFVLLVCDCVVLWQEFITWCIFVDMHLVSLFSALSLSPK